MNSTTTDTTVYPVPKDKCALLASETLTLVPHQFYLLSTYLSIDDPIPKNFILHALRTDHNHPYTILNEFFWPHPTSNTYFMPIYAFKNHTIQKDDLLDLVSFVYFHRPSGAFTLFFSSPYGIKTTFFFW